MSPQYIIFLTICFISSVIAKKGGGGRSGGGSIGRSGGSSYPSSHGLSGTNTYSKTYDHSYQRTNVAHTYPHATGLSGSSTHNTGPSGNYQRTQSTSYVHKSEVHHHYHYSPPQQISYGSQYHPVFHGQPPVYVYEYRNSGSRFDSLLTGLALYNLGRMSGNRNHQSYNTEYRGNPGEICKLSISKSNGEYEQTRIDCKLMSSFIWDWDREQKHATVSNNVVINTINVTNTINGSNSNVSVQTTTVEALQAKGPSIVVTPGMTCFMIRTSRDSSQLKRKVDCGLLQEYAKRSLRYNQCSRTVPSLSILFLTLTILNYVYNL